MADKAEVERILVERLGWYERNLRIRDEHGEIVPLVLNNIQIQLERHAIECEQDDIPCYELVLKARQGGVSTWAEAHLFRKALLEAETRVLVTAHKDDASRNIFKMARRYYDNLPKLPGTNRSAANAIVFAHNQSEFIVQTAGSGAGAGRSYTLTGWHNSEVDYAPDPKELMTAVMQTIPKVGGTIRIVESTANGPGLEMHNLWNRATSGRGDWKPFFFPWFDLPKYSKDISWKTLKSYGPTDWVTRNREIFDQKEAIDAVDAISRRRDQHEEGGGGGVRGKVEGRGRSNGKEGGEAGSSPDGPAAIDGGHGRGAGSPVRRKGHEGNRSNAPGAFKPATKGSRSKPIEDCRRIVRSLRKRGGDHLNSIQSEELRASFRDSLTSYELGLIAEFNLTYEQINCLRFLLESECNGDETKRMREYPSRASECFMASGGDVLDQVVLADWHDQSSRYPHKARVIFVPEYDSLGRPIMKYQEDKRGTTTIFDWPKPNEEFVMFVDCAQGTSDGDWTVGYVMNVETGEQAAEYRAKEDPDAAVDQIELLAMLYNKAFTAIEVNGGFGWPFLSHMSQRAYLNNIPLYERTAYDRRNGIKVKVKKPGWDTSTKTRPILVAASKEAVRKKRCRIRSLATIEECQTLHSNQNRGGKVEARSGFHDDGWIAFAGACVLRNERVTNHRELVLEEGDRKKYPLFSFVHEESDRRKQHEADHFKDMALREVAPVVAVMPIDSTGPDDQRSWL